MSVVAFLVFVSVIEAAMLVAVVALTANYSGSRDGPRLVESSHHSIVAVVGAGAGLAE